MNVNSFLSPILELLLSFLAELSRAGFNALPDAEQKLILGWVPTLYVAAVTKGEEFVKSTATPFDDQALDEVLDFIIGLQTDGLVKLPVIPA